MSLDSVAHLVLAALIWALVGAAVIATVAVYVLLVRDVLAGCRRSRTADRRLRRAEFRRLERSLGLEPWPFGLRDDDDRPGVGSDWAPRFLAAVREELERSEADAQ